MTESRRHMERFSHARSAAAVLFWQGKVLERQAQPVDAKAAYETLLKRYPISYYAFRADGRLKALDPNTEDPRWQVLDAHRAYPPPLDAMRISVVDAVLDLDPALAEAARELEHIEAPDDMRTLLLAYRDKLPPIIESWIRQQSGDTAGSIRVVRDALNTRNPARRSRRVCAHPGRNATTLPGHVCRADCKSGSPERPRPLVGSIAHA